MPKKIKFNPYEEAILRDFEAGELKPVTEGLPYQTLISSLVHKYASGQLVERA
jgi:predicted DNA binding CopG/RHH family protein